MNVLIVEDDDRIADFLSRGLRADGYRVQRAADGVTGLSQAQEAARQAQAGGETTLLLPDPILPGLAGLEICQTLRAARVSLLTSMLTGQGSLEDRVAGRDMRPRPASRLQVGDLELDRDRMQASRGGRALQLTARELALLEVLMSAPGRLFSRERILANVWGTSEDPLTNIVDVYIRRLRARIDGDGLPALIHTVRGLGYRLELTAQG